MNKYLCSDSFIQVMIPIPDPEIILIITALVRTPQRCILGANKFCLLVCLAECIAISLIRDNPIKENLMRCYFERCHRRRIFLLLHP